MENQLPEPVRQLICDKHSCDSDLPATYYVHMDSGSVEEVTEVTGLQVTDTELIFERGQSPTVTFPRYQVYYACCQKDDEPPSLF